MANSLEARYRCRGEGKRRHACWARCKHPLNASDFSSFLLQAQNSKAQVLGLANAGGDTINAIKAAKEFGINKTMKMAGLLVFITDIHSLGLNNTEGLLLTTSWDWNLNDQTRAFGKKFFEKTKRMPTDIQAADYSATMNYLKACAGRQHRRRRQGHGLPQEHAAGRLLCQGRHPTRWPLRARHVPDAGQVPAESKQPWDYYKVVTKLPGDQVFTTKAESKCALWK